MNLPEHGTGQCAAFARRRLDIPARVTMQGLLRRPVSPFGRSPPNQSSAQLLKALPKDPLIARVLRANIQNRKG